MELSFEFFPPRSSRQREQLDRTVGRLAAYRPAFCSVTFGAGGSTREATADAVMDIQRGGGTAVPHVSCMGGTADQLSALLREYQAAGINRIVALRGDRPSGSVGEPDLPHASDLVALARREFNDAFHIDVACYPECHPESPSASADLDHFAHKVAAGANGAITQYFYNADAYFRFVEACATRGIDTPIVPGIMPISNYRQLAAFSERCGAEIPRWLGRRLADFGDDLVSLRAFGADVVGNLCQTLLDGGAPGLHIYTLNRANTTRAVCSRLGVRPAIEAQTAS